MAWKPKTVQTEMMEIESSLDWDLIMSGKKSEIRSTSPLIDPVLEVPTLAMLHHRGKLAPAVISHAWREEMADISEEDAIAEGFDSLVAFKRHWCSKNGLDTYIVSQRAWGYEILCLFDGTAKDGDERSEAKIEAALNIVNHLYPSHIS